MALQSTLHKLDTRTTPQERAELALLLSDACAKEPPDVQLSQTADDCLIYLARAAEERVRQTMALKLAECTWAPPKIIQHLAFDVISVAEPILTRSLVLDEDTLIKLARTTPDKRLVIARRTHVSEPLTRELASYREYDVINTLARNDGARLPEKSAPDFAEVARGDSDLQAALTSRDDLTLGFATVLLTVAADEISKRLRARFPELPARVLEDFAEEASVEAISVTTEEGAARLTLKMHASGQLNASFAVKSLQEGKANLFDHSIARLTGLPVRDWRRALGTSPLRACGLAGRAIAIDADAVNPIVKSLIELGRIHMIEPHLIRRAASEIYATYGRDEARKALHRLGADGSID